MTSDAGRVLVVGEVLVDLVPEPATPPPAASPPTGASLCVVAHAGGSPANVAVGLARLGTPALFAGRISTGGFGPWLRAYLEANGVDTAPSLRAPEPASLALVTLGAAGAATYTFYLEETADWQWSPGELPDPRTLGATAVHTGSLAVALPPGGDVVAGWIRGVREARDVFLSIDPNVRPGLTGDLGLYRRRLAGLVAASHLVKVSDEDLAVLHPGEDPVRAAVSWAGSGPEIVVVTHGADGASLVRSNRAGEVQVLHEPSPRVQVVDTVGAGDAFTAALLTRLATHDALHPGGATLLDAGELGDCLRFANLAAAVSCTRAGADPPAMSDLAGLPA